MHRHHPGWRLVLWAWADVYPKKPERSSEAQAFQIKENIKWPFKNMMLEKLLKNTLTFNPWNTFLRKWRLTLTICGDTQKQSDLWPSFVPPQSVLLYLNCERSFWITWQNFNYPLWINKWGFFLIFQPVTRKDLTCKSWKKHQTLVMFTEKELYVGLLLICPASTLCPETGGDSSESIWLDG